MSDDPDVSGLDARFEHERRDASAHLDHVTDLQTIGPLHHGESCIRKVAADVDAGTVRILPIDQVERVRLPGNDTRDDAGDDTRRLPRSLLSIERSDLRNGKRLGGRCHPDQSHYDYRLLHPFDYTTNIRLVILFQ